MGYEQLLDEAYENVEVSEECGRFEIRSVEGHHEGSKTVVSNFVQVASCIRRAPVHLMKFLCKELASSGELKGDRLIMSRKVSSKEINDKVEKYVGRYVLCPKCKKPDTELVEESGKSYVRCLACGERYEVHKI